MREQLPLVADLLQAARLGCDAATEQNIQGQLNALRVQLLETADASAALDLLGTSMANIENEFRFVPRAVHACGVDMPECQSFEEDAAKCIEIATSLVTRRIQSLKAGEEMV